MSLPSSNPQSFERLVRLYEGVLRPGLFRFDSEWIHNRTLDALGWLSRDCFWRDLLGAFFESPRLETELMGLKFPNPVGLAAGMDKRAAALPIWEHLGFGFTELGGVTCLEQPGNPAPRMFRAVPHEALVNRMGFNNPGAVRMARQLFLWRESGNWPAHPVGMNLGKSKLTPLDKAAEDYGESFLHLHRYVDFFVINVSSPNTPNLRKLQDKAALQEILKHLKGIRRQLESELPLLVKVAPDLSLPAFDEILELAMELELDGLVCSNTTLARPETEDAASKKTFGETGGLSGRPLKERSTELIRHAYQHTAGKLPIIGVGGIFTPEDAWEKICAGSSLIQIYSGLVFKGPALPAWITAGLIAKLKENGVTSLQEVVGSEAR